MQHTNSQRGSDGRFSQSETPKAKRVEVWLQPQTVELLDTLTKQWGVGRGKVIDQLLTRGPVPPQSWSTVTEAPTPTPPPSAPPDDFEDGDFWSLPEEEQLAYFKQVLPEVTEMAKTMPHFEALRRDYVERLEQHEAKAKREPTTSGQGTVFDTPEYKAMQEKMSRHWDICKADAKAVPGATAKRVQAFKARHRIGADTPLSPDAQQLLRDEMENDRRTIVGNERAADERLTDVRTRLEQQPSLAQAIYDQCKTVDVDKYVAADYLLRLLPVYGVKPYKKLCKGLWDSLPQMEHVNSLALELSEEPARRALFLGVILRLYQLEGEPPTTGGAFLEWGHVETYKKHASRLDSGAFGMGDWFANRMSENDARGILKLPTGVALTSKAISDAFKSLAKKAHPDMGGTAEQMDRLSKAKERLMLSVGA